MNDIRMMKPEERRELLVKTYRWAKKCDRRVELDKALRLAELLRLNGWEQVYQTGYSVHYAIGPASESYQGNPSNPVDTRFAIRRVDTATYEVSVHLDPWFDTV